MQIQEDCDVSPHSLAIIKEAVNSLKSLDRDSSRKHVKLHSVHIPGATTEQDGSKKSKANQKSEHISIMNLPNESNKDFFQASEGDNMRKISNFGATINDSYIQTSMKNIIGDKQRAARNHMLNTFTGMGKRMMGNAVSTFISSSENKQGYWRHNSQHSKKTTTEQSTRVEPFKANTVGMVENFNEWNETTHSKNNSEQLGSSRVTMANYNTGGLSGNGGLHMISRLQRPPSSKRKTEGDPDAQKPVQLPDNRMKRHKLVVDEKLKEDEKDSIPRKKKVYHLVDQLQKLKVKNLKEDGDKCEQNQLEKPARTTQGTSPIRKRSITPLIAAEPQ